MALFLPTLRHGWVYDDVMEVVNNTFIRGLGHLPAIFTSTVWAGSGMETYLYRPLAVASYALNHVVSGLEPWSYHLVNVLLHGAVSGMVVRVGMMWGLPAAAAGAAGILFAVHPVHVEAVAPVFGRKDLLAAFFTLALVLLHAGAVAKGGWRRLAAPAAYLAAMLSKEVGVMGLALVAVHDLRLTSDLRALAARRDVSILYASYLGAAALLLVVRTAVTGGLGIPDTAFLDNPLVAAGPAARMATALVVAAKGIALTALPLAQSPDYSFDAIPLVASPWDARLVGAALGLTALVVVLAHPRTRRSVFAHGVAWYALALLPSANVLLLSGTIFAERLLYLPSVGFCLVAGAGVARAAQAASRAVPVDARALTAVLAVLLAAPTALLARAYTSRWTDDVTLFSHAVQVVPNSTKAHHKLGEELLRTGAVGPALGALERALEIAPDNPWAAETLAQARGEAVRRWGARPLPPSLDPAALRGAGLPSDADVLHALGLSAMGGDEGRAEAYWRAALAVEPAHARAGTELGALLAGRGAVPEAVALLEGVTAAHPGFPPAWFNLGALRTALGDTDGARRAFGRFLEVGGGRYPAEAARARAALASTG